MAGEMAALIGQLQRSLRPKPEVTTGHGTPCWLWTGFNGASGRSLR